MVISHRGVVTWVPLDQRPPPSNQPAPAGPVRKDKSIASDSPLVQGAVAAGEEVPQSCGERYAWIF